MGGVSDLQRRTPNRVSRKQREQRAFQLLVGGSVLGAVAVVGILLALFTSFGAGLPILAGILAVVCFVLFRRQVS